MPKLLKDLKINEVSSVDRGAGEGVQIMLMKRQADDATAGTVGKATAALRACINSMFPDETGAESKALDQAFADFKEHLLGNLPGVEKIQKQEPTMAESSATIAILKGALDRGSPMPVDRGTITKMLDAGAAAIRKAGETKEQAFTRFATETEDGKVLFKAHRLAKGSDAPVAPEPEPNPDTALPSYQKLQAKAAEMRKADPKLSEAQAFTKVFSDPANADLNSEYYRECRAL